MAKTYAVGDEILDDDYEHLPIGTEVRGWSEVLRKVNKEKWVSKSGLGYKSSELRVSRVITKLPEPEPVSDKDIVNEPPRYKIADGVEVIDVINALAKDDWYFGSAIEYLLRHKAKGNPKQDLEKCRWMIDKMLEGLS